MQSKTQFLVVCTGNICRSPTAEVVLRHHLHRRGFENLAVDSAGTHSYHIGEAPDARSQAAALRRGYDLSDLRARQVERADFERFDWILAMDSGHLRWLQQRRPQDARAQVQMFMPQDIPDPYYGGAEGFEQVLNLLETGAEAWAARLQQG